MKTIAIKELVLQLVSSFRKLKEGEVQKKDETIAVVEEDFLANVCPLNPDNIEDCQACQ